MALCVCQSVCLFVFLSFCLSFTSKQIKFVKFLHLLTNHNNLQKQQEQNNNNKKTCSRNKYVT